MKRLGISFRRDVIYNLLPVSMVSARKQEIRKLKKFPFDSGMSQVKFESNSIFRAYQIKWSEYNNAELQ